MTQVDPGSVAIQGIGDDELAVANQGFILGEGSGSQIRNRIITRGLGMSRGKAGRVGPITQGYGGPSSFIVEVIRRNLDFRRRYGGTGNRDRFEKLYPIVVWAKLIEVNGRHPSRPIEGFTTVSVKHENSKRASVGFLTSRVKSILEVVKVTVRRIRNT